MPRRIGVFSLGLLLSLVTIGARGAPPAAPVPPPTVKPASGTEESPSVAADRLVEQLKKHPVAELANPSAVPLYLLDTKDGRVTRIAGEVVPGLIHTGVIDWSPDGRRIVFDLGQSPSKEQNWWIHTQLVLIERGDDRPLVRKLGLGSLPSFNSIGDQVLFMLFSGMGAATKSTFWIMNSDGSSREMLEEMGRPRMAPGGRFCLICGLGKPTQIRLVDLSTGFVRPINFPERNIFSIPSWIDEKSFVAMTGVDRPDHVSVIDVSNPEKIQIQEDLWTRGKDQEFKPRSPVYFPETGICAFIGREAGRVNTIYWFKKGRPQELKHYEAVSGDAMEGLGKSPGGRYLLYGSDGLTKPK